MSQNKYLSKYSNGKLVSAAQFISELVCERLAKKQKKDLHYRFWLSDEWQKEYKGQIATANKLLKKYEAKFIIEALLSDVGKKIYSLRAPHLPDTIEKIMKKKPSEAKPAVVIQRNMLDKGHQKSTSTKNIIDKLKDIE